MHTDFQQRYGALNAAQRLAVDTLEGPLLVVAGPGSGKTELLSVRVAAILQRTDMVPRNILCLTFTDSAASTMRKRLAQLIGADAYQVGIFTFHSFGTEVINRFPQYFYNGARPQPIDDLGRAELLMQCLRDLPATDPLRKEHPEEGFTYLQDVATRIGQCKKAALRPDELLNLITQNQAFSDWITPHLSTAFAGRVGKQTQSLVGELLQEVTDYVRHESSTLPPQLTSLAEVTRRSLAAALTQSIAENATRPLTDWKKDHTVKSLNETQVLKEVSYAEKLTSLAAVYERYQELLYQKALFDYDDMLLLCIQALHDYPEMRAELQEQFQYILVDEFQDTNDAQMRLLRLLAESEQAPTTPNLMVVGDDDQGVYKFQGAELSNIVNFRAWYPSAPIITLTDNYRSTQHILDIARSVITQGHERLELIFPEIVKDLTAAKRKHDGTVTYVELETSELEVIWLADEIQRLAKSGVPLSDIAVISRRHTELQSLVPHIYQRGIPVTYEKQEDVLQAQHIQELLTIIRAVQALAEPNPRLADVYLSQVLSFPLFAIDRGMLWDISLACYEQRIHWIDALRGHTDSHLKNLANQFLSWAAVAKTEPADTLVAALVGANDLPVEESSDSDALETIGTTEGLPRTPYKEFYFSEAARIKDPGLYLQRLTALQVFIQAIRGFRPGSRPTLSDILEMLDLYTQTDTQITNTSVLQTGIAGVQLLTAHKAKGMEFPYVFVMSCQDDVWKGKGGSSKLPLPANLQLGPDKDGHDDYLRLLYVALTRAEEHLILSGYRHTEKGKESLRLRFLSNLAPEQIPIPEAVSERALLAAHAWDTRYIPPYTADEKAVLAPLVEDYVLSATHLINYLDVTSGGPRSFLLHNLLRYPEPRASHIVYGTAMHAIIRDVYGYLTEHGKLPSLHQVKDWLVGTITAARISEEETRVLIERGFAALHVFMKDYAPKFAADHVIERDFMRQHVSIGEARITGKIDRMILNNSEKTITVSDFKTGSILAKWSESDEYKKVKAWRNRMQLMVYKLLVEHARDYAGVWTVEKAELVFVEPALDGTIHTLPLTYTDEELVRTKKLITAVYKNICTLEFPDTSELLQANDGLSAIKRFEDRLLGY